MDQFLQLFENTLLYFCKIETINSKNFARHCHFIFDWIIIFKSPKGIRIKGLGIVFRASSSRKRKSEIKRVSRSKRESKRRGIKERKAKKERLNMPQKY